MIYPSSVGVQRIVWSSTRVGPRLYQTLYTAPNKWFRLKVVVMRTDTNYRDEKVSDIKINGRSIGGCNPDGEDYECTFYDCSLNENVLGDHLADTVLRSNAEGIWKFEIKYSHTVDATPECKYNNQNKVQAAVGISLDPLEGIFDPDHLQIISNPFFYEFC